MKKRDISSSITASTTQSREPIACQILVCARTQKLKQCEEGCHDLSTKTREGSTLIGSKLLTDFECTDYIIEYPETPWHCTGQ